MRELVDVEEENCVETVTTKANASPSVIDGILSLPISSSLMAPTSSFADPFPAILSKKPPATNFEPPVFSSSSVENPPVYPSFISMSLDGNDDLPISCTFMVALFHVVTPCYKDSAGAGETFVDDGKFFHVGKNSIPTILPITTESDPVLSPITTTFHMVTPCYCDGEDVSDGAAIEPSENAIDVVYPRQNCVVVENEFKRAISGRSSQLTFFKWPDSIDVARWLLEIVKNVLKSKCYMKEVKTKQKLNLFSAKLFGCYSDPLSSITGHVQLIFLRPSEH